MIFRMIVHRPEIGNALDTLIDATGLSPSSLVHHLREMERCGVLSRKRKGVHVAYRVTPGSFTAALAAALRMSEATRGATARVA